VEPVLVANLVTTFALIGLIWTVQLAVYPLYARVDRESFPAWHAGWMRRITVVVGPLMLAEAAAAVWLLLAPPPTLCAPSPYVAFVLVLVNWLATAFLLVPCHRRLETGFDARAHRRLVRLNWIRTLAWSARGAVLLIAIS
jgi:hypothetical protein